MNNFAFLLIICSAINTETGSVNYCGSRMCGHTDRHTFCKYQPGPGATCAGYIEAPLSSAEKENVLARLNRRRSDAAMGLDDWPPAGNMLKLMWVNELAREAQLWADQCIPPASVEEHDECRHLYSVTVGQCVASVVGEAPGLRPETMVDMWFMQRISYVGNLTSYMLSTTYQDFAQIVWSRAFLVGCARSRFMAEMRGRMRTVERLVCNFAPQGPALNRPLWALGEPASLCPSRAIPDKEYPALCVFPDAYQRVQQELQRMETMLSTPSSTSASKVRRELRNYDQPTKYPDDAKTKQLLAEIERNKTIERGPMLNMVLKYVPLLKPYEKSILGSVEDNGVARLVPTTVLLVAVCL
ncbi:venom allergen 5-like isoform X3 [Leptidea sinapis]|uniref:venom allergen 5-like isoform X3 n=1 Tax=Leptidea sinapis TaxID=189913 RepID=UPI00212CCA9C|nr:venom allergen 5-like isoform X3 [Leptidea sinapis]